MSCSAGKVTAPTLRIVSYAISSGKVRDLVGTFDWLVELCAAASGDVARRKVRSAVELDDAEARAVWLPRSVVSSDARSRSRDRSILRSSAAC